MPDRLIRLRDALARVGMSRAAWYDAVRAGQAPRPVRIGRRAVAWVEAEVSAYIADRIAERDAREGDHG